LVGLGKHCRGDPRQSSEGKDQPLELILARNLVSIISLAAFLVDVDWHIVFYNDAAAEIMGSRFEETGSLAREQWNAEVGPLDEQGVPVPLIACR
jgi:PAS domain-containing protein